MKISKKVIIISSVSAFVIIAAGSAILLSGSKAPNPQKQTPEDIRKFFESSEFKKLSIVEQRKYAGKAMETMIVSSATEYVQLPAEERITYLDKIIDEMETRRKEFMARRNQSEGSQPSSKNAAASATAAARTGSPSGRTEGGFGDMRFGPRPDGQNRPDGQRPTGDRQRRRPGIEAMRTRSESMTPENRAIISAFMRDMQQRRQQRGLN